jgi:hypothetical protein
VAQAINLDLVEIALDRVSGDRFEKFVLAFYPSIAGEEFVPLGGMSDGGADAFQSTNVFQGNQTGCFYQSSTQKDCRQKIRATVKRLREVGRLPTALIYVTSIRVPSLDREELDLSTELGVNVRIRDRGYIQAHVNDAIGTRAAFDTYLRPELSFLGHFGSPGLLAPSNAITSPTVYVFLRQELERSEGHTNPIDAITDGLILWALEGTDPDKNVLMSAEEVSKKIAETIPQAVNVLSGLIPRRLRRLAKVPKAYGRAVRWHRDQNRYCLAYEVRSRLEEDNARDEALRLRVREAFENRLRGLPGPQHDDVTISKVAELSFSAIQRTFEQEGLAFSAFLQGSFSGTKIPPIGDHVDHCMIEAKVPAADTPRLKELILRNLQGAFYASTEEERIYFARLATTITVLFCLRTEPEVVRYFQGMAADFELFVGSDLLVRALSERYLRQEDQITRNALRIIRHAGATLVLAEPVLDEVFTHVRAADMEFEANYEKVEMHITEEIFRNSDRILIRAYFYARRFAPEGINGPHNWQQFLDSFCDPRLIRTAEGREEIRKYLSAEFGLRYETRRDLEAVVDKNELRNLATRLRDYKKREELALNDALMVLAVYGRRHTRHEHSEVSQYGYRTWWLTGESRVLNHTQDLLKQKGTSYLMRPDFVVRFLALAPSVAEVRRTYASVFPSLLGVKLARRVAPTEISKVLHELVTAQDLEEGRRLAKVAHLSDKLKTRFYAPGPKEEEDEEAG